MGLRKVNRETGIRGVRGVRGAAPLQCARAWECKRRQTTEGPARETRTLSRSLQIHANIIVRLLSKLLGLVWLVEHFISTHAAIDARIAPERKILESGTSDPPPVTITHRPAERTQIIASTYCTTRKRSSSVEPHPASSSHIPAALRLKPSIFPWLHRRGIFNIRYFLLLLRSSLSALSLSLCDSLRARAVLKLLQLVAQ